MTLWSYIVAKFSNPGYIDEKIVGRILFGFFSYFYSQFQQ